jgi:probable HAF family extracellular repeat protein
MKWRTWLMVLVAMVSLLTLAGEAGAEFQDLGTIAGNYSGARAINDLGQVVGVSTTPIWLTNHAFFYDGTMHDLGTLGGSNSVARGINNSGQVVGNSQIMGGNTHGFLYSGGTMTDLGTLGGTYCIAYGINDAGQIVGVSTTAAGKSPCLCVHRRGHDRPEHPHGEELWYCLRHQ